MKEPFDPHSHTHTYICSRKPRLYSRYLQIICIYVALRWTDYANQTHDFLRMFAQFLVTSTSVVIGSRAYAAAEFPIRFVIIVLLSDANRCRSQACWSLLGRLCLAPTLRRGRRLRTRPVDSVAVLVAASL